MRIITNINELDSVFAECDLAAKASDDELRRVFQTFRMEIPAPPSLDPFSEGYAAFQMQLYERIAGRPYHTNNEEVVFDVESCVVRPFPYTASCQVAGNHLGAIAFLVRSMRLRPGSRVLDVGAGWGNTTLALAQLGFDVTALDLESRFCELIRERARRVGVQPEIVNGDFFWIESSGRQFDAIVFFESFHHCADHLRLLRALRSALTPEGQVYFGGEPITPDFPIPWGIRTDGESLWAIRRHGWLELGFQAKYFSAALQRSGFQAQMQSSADLPWINVWTAAHVPEVIRSDASGHGLAPQTETGVKEKGFTHLENRPEGYALPGPLHAFTGWALRGKHLLSQWLLGARKRIDRRPR